jgi:TonB family protein
VDVEGLLRAWLVASTPAAWSALLRTVEITGCIGRLEVLHTTGNGQLDYRALQAVSAWRFEPTRVNGRRVRVTITATVTFKLQ